MSAILKKIAAFGLASVVWLGTGTAFAEQRSQIFSVSIYATACSMLGVPVQSFSNQVTVEGTAVDMPFFLYIIDEPDLRMMVSDETVDLDKLSADSEIIPIKPFDDEVRVGNGKLSVEGRQEIVKLCKLFG